MKNFKNPPTQQNPQAPPNIDINEFPGYTKYSKKCHCFTLVDNRIYFCTKSSWEITLTMPIIVYLLSLGGLAVFIYFIIQHYWVFGVIYSIFLVVTCFMFLFCYTKTIYTKPGYFPFYYSWAIENKLPPTEDETVNGIEESFAGVACTLKQIEWAKLQKRPARSMLARSARRYVIRPDHFCGWVGTWIGKRNHKFFILFNLYGCIYLALLSIGLLTSFGLNFTKIPIYLNFVNMVFLLLSISFTILTGSFLYTAMSHGLKNITQWEKWNYIPEESFDRGSPVENLKDIFGERDICCWICPSDPFPGLTNNELIEDYLEYDQARSIFGKETDILPPKQIDNDTPLYQA